MWRRNAWLVAVLLVHEAATSSLGHQRPPASLVTKSRWARFELFLGRINAVSILGGQRRCAQKRGPQDEVHETLAINTDADLPTIRYELADDEQNLSIVVVNRTEIEICREPRQGSALAYVRYTQPRRGAIKLFIQRDDWSRLVEAPSLWHLLLAEPRLCREHLLPLLQPLNPNWRLQESIERIEATLCGTPATNLLPRGRVKQLLAQMDAPNFSKRQVADRELRALGIAALPYLRSLDTSQMAREQRSRVKRICEDLAGQSLDAPERIAAWLGHDEKLWQSWINHPDAQRRSAALQGLAALDRRPTPADQDEPIGITHRVARVPASP